MEQGGCLITDDRLRPPKVGRITGSTDIYDGLDYILKSTDLQAGAGARPPIRSPNQAKAGYGSLRHCCLVLRRLIPVRCHQAILQMGRPCPV